MTITASGGTDGANVVLFWPDNLPDGADALLATDPIHLAERQRDQGKLIWFPCEGDGGYTVGVFVRREIPAELRVHCKDEGRIPGLVVRGVGYFGGLEYMFKHDSRLLKKYPAMCQPVHVPEGMYSARVYRTEVPDGLYDSWLVSQAGARAKRMWDIHGGIAACAVVSVAASAVAVFALPRAAWLWALAAAVAVALSAVMMSRAEWYKRVARARDAFERAYPSYVVHLE